MTNTSATGGVLSPNSTPLSDQAFTRAIQQMLSGVSGIVGTLVRNRWQENPPAQPEPSVDWCAFGAIETATIGTVDIVHDSSGEGKSDAIEHEEVTFLISCYGPNGQQVAKRLRNGLKVPQNWEQCTLACGARLIDVSDMRMAPALINQQWVRKWDLTLRVRSAVRLNYDILNLLSAHGTIKGELDEEQPFTVEQ